jgi:hypothetical protein
MKEGEEERREEEGGGEDEEERRGERMESKQSRWRLVQRRTACGVQRSIIRPQATRPAGRPPLKRP